MITTTFDKHHRIPGSADFLLHRQEFYDHQDKKWADASLTAMDGESPLLRLRLSIAEGHPCNPLEMHSHHGASFAGIEVNPAAPPLLVAKALSAVLRGAGKMAKLLHYRDTPDFLPVSRHFPTLMTMIGIHPESSNLWAVSFGKEPKKKWRRAAAKCRSSLCDSTPKEISDFLTDRLVALHGLDAIHHSEVEFERLASVNWCKWYSASHGSLLVGGAMVYELAPGIAHVHYGYAERGYPGVNNLIDAEIMRDYEIVSFGSINFCKTHVSRGLVQYKAGSGARFVPVNRYIIDCYEVADKLDALIKTGRLG